MKNKIDNKSANELKFKSSFTFSQRHVCHGEVLAGGDRLVVWLEAPKVTDRVDTPSPVDCHYKFKDRDDQRNRPGFVPKQRRDQSRQNVAEKRRKQEIIFVLEPHDGIGSEVGHVDFLPRLDDVRILRPTCEKKKSS